MNLLAHFTLSGTHNAELSAGNFLGDFVKGKKLENYPAGIKKGILLHRAIDSYTDHHPLVLQSKRRLYSRFHHYSAVLVDIYYDHFLALHFHEYHSRPLPEFCQGIYSLLEQQKSQLTEKALFVLPYLKRDNWLLNYRTMEGIDRACKGIARRSPYASQMEKGVEGLQEHYTFLEQDFRTFFNDIREYVKNWLADYDGKPNNGISP